MAKTKTPRRRPRPTALLASSDFIAYLREKADELAPADLQPILTQAPALLSRAERERRAHPRLQRQVELALRLLADHSSGAAPQIPYHTVCLLAVAMLYFENPLGVIPDWIPGVGTADDALVFELAFELGGPGIRRYCTWKGLSTDGVLQPPTAAAPPARTRRPGRRSKS